MAVTARRTGTKVFTGLVRFDFPHVFEKDTSDMGGDKYNITILIPKSDKETVRVIQEAIEEAKDQGMSSKWNGSMPRRLWEPLRDGDEKAEENKYTEYADCYYIVAKSKDQPGIVDRDRMPIYSADEFYAGCYGRVTISFYPYAASGSNGVAAGLYNIQKLKDGQRLGSSKASAEDDFADEVDVDDDIDSML